MIKNHLKIAWRTIFRNPAQSAIVIGGLATSLAVVLLILLWVQNELSYNNYYTDADRIFLLSEIDERDGGVREETPYPIYEVAQSDIPEVEQAAVGFDGKSVDLVFDVDGRKFYEREALFIDSNWLRFFDYRLVDGSFVHFRDEPNVIAISESKAKQYFGHDTAVGKTIVVDSIPTIVTAVFADVPTNSSFRQGILMPLPSLFKKRNYQRFKDDWGGYLPFIFMKLHHSADPTAVASKITPFFKKNQAYRKGTKYHHQLVRLTDIHLGGHGFSRLPQGNKNTIVIFSVLALLLLLTASVNIVNLAIARMTARHKEVGIRKVTGATNGQLFGQVITETLVTIVICAMLTILLLIGMLPYFNRYFETALVFSPFDPDTLMIVITTFGAVTLLTGVYPALLTGKTSPLQLFRGMAIGQSDNKRFREVLMVGQMVLAVVMLVAVVVIHTQFKYIQQTADAYQMDQVFSFRRPNMGLSFFAGSPEHQDFIRQLNTIKQDISQHSSVKAVTRVNGVSLIDQTNKRGIAYDWTGYPKLEEQAQAVVMWIDHDYSKLADVQLVAGRWFHVDNTSDHRNILINETAVKAFGLKEPVVGTTFDVMGIYQGTVIGVVKDFHHASIHQPIEPVVFELDQGGTGGMGGKFMVEAHGGRIAEALAATETIWNRHYPGKPFEYVFLDEEFDRLYKDDQKALVLSLVFAGLSLLISALGILAMAMFTTQRRVKEIGIRKVLGASVSGILVLLSKDFMKLVLIAVVIASPVAWWAMNKWLEDFAYRIDIQWWMFSVAGLVAVVIALLTMSWQTIRTAVANPVDSLRDE